MTDEIRKTLCPYPPITTEINPVPLATSASTAQDATGAEPGQLVIYAADCAFQICWAATANGTYTNFVVKPAGEYQFLVVPGREFFKVKAVAGTGVFSWYVEKSS